MNGGFHFPTDACKKARFEGVEFALNGEGELSMNSTKSEIKQVKTMADDN